MSMWKPRVSVGRRSGSLSAGESFSIPTHFRCPISLELMKDPVTASTGITYDRQSIETWVEVGNASCPVTNQPISKDDLIPNHSLRKMIQDWCVANRSHGVERIPTPRIPVTPTEASEIVREIGSASEVGNQAGCKEVVRKVKALARESERNRRCISSNGGGRALAGAFDAFAREGCDVRGTGILEEILSAMMVTFPLDQKACSCLSSPASMTSLVCILRYGNLSGRLNAVLALKELVNPEKGNNLSDVASTEGLAEALVKLIKEPVSPQTTKASLIVSFYLIDSSNLSVASSFVDMGMVELLVDMLVDCDRGTCEKALGVIDGLCRCEAGREAAGSNALTVPVLVKKMFRVSDMATEFAVAVLWRLCNGCSKRGECMAEALQVGAFQKLLLLLQVGCGEGTKEKATELLKLLNTNRGRMECIESMDFKGLKRPF